MGPYIGLYIELLYIGLEIYSSPFRALHIKEAWSYIHGPIYKTHACPGSNSQNAPVVCCDVVWRGVVWKMTFFVKSRPRR